jgi:putative transposase
MLKVVHDASESNESAGGSLLDEIVRDGARQMLAAALQAEVAVYIEAFADEVDEARSAAGGAQRSPRVAGGDHGGGRDPGACTAGQRQARRPDHRAAAAVRLGDPAGVGEEVAEGCRGVAAAVPARPVQRRLRPGADPVPRLRCGPVGGHDHPADEGLARRGGRVQQALVGRDRLRVRVGRRDPPQGPPRAGQGVPAGDDRRARRRHEGTDRARRRAPGVDRVLARPAPVLQATWHAGTGARGRRRCTRVLGRGARGVPRPPASNAAGSTRSPTSSTCCRSRPSPARRPRWPRSGTPRTSDHAKAAARAFAADYGTKWPKAAAKITEDLDVLLAFYDYPAEHWVHLRTTNPIESTFATVRLRQRVTKGPGSGAGASRWRSSSSSPRNDAGARSTPRTSSPSSAPAPPSSAASSSNDPRNQDASKTSHDTPIHRS